MVRGLRLTAKPPSARSFRTQDVFHGAGSRLRALRRIPEPGAEILGLVREWPVRRHLRRAPTHPWVVKGRPPMAQSPLVTSSTTTPVTERHLLALDRDHGVGESLHN